VGMEWGPLSLVRTNEELLECKSSGSGSRKSRLTTVGIRCGDHATSYIRKFGTDFSDMRRSFGRYISFADYKYKEFYSRIRVFARKY
jgi:hypothetical protein